MAVVWVLYSLVETSLMNNFLRSQSSGMIIIIIILGRQHQLIVPRGQGLSQTITKNQ